MATNPLTPNFGLRTPDGNEAPDVPLWLGYLAADVDAVFGAWKSYTPTLTCASGVHPTNYTAAGRYFRAGKLVLVRYSITLNTGFTAGTGSVYLISLPAPALQTAPSVPGATSGAVRLYDASSSNAHLAARVGIADANNVAIQYTSTHGGPLGTVGPGAPWAWAPGDSIDGYAFYEAA